MQDSDYRIPEYDDALSKLLTAVHDGLRMRHPILGQVKIRTTEHSGPTRNVIGQTPLDQPLHDFEFSTTLADQTIRESHLDEITFAIYDLATQALEGAFRSLIGTVNNVTEATGNVLHAHGKPLTLDMLNDMLETIDIDFDENGNPRMPALVAGPDVVRQLLRLQPTHEQLERQKQILGRKRAEHDARQRTRRLPRQGQGARA